MTRVETVFCGASMSFSYEHLVRVQSWRRAAKNRVLGGSPDEVAEQRVW